MKHGHCAVPPKLTTLNLWVKRQRYYPEKLSTSQHKLLDRIGFRWTYADSQWEQFIHRLQDYLDKKDEGGLLTKQLSSQLAYYRKLYREGQLEPERAVELETIDPRLALKRIRNEKLNQQVFERLKAFYAAHGHFDFIEVNSAEAKFLSKQVVKIRLGKLAGRPSMGLVELLDSINFPWDKYTYRWKRMFTKLQQTMTERKKLKHPLMAWWRRQRILASQDELSLDRRALLDTIAFKDPRVYHWSLQFEDAEVAFLKLKKYDGSLTRRNVRKAADVNGGLHKRRLAASIENGKKVKR